MLHGPLLHVLGPVRRAVAELTASLSPQQSTPPSASRAQASNSPAVIAVALLMPLTATGVKLVVVLPFPSCPSSFKPQRSTLPANKAHVLPPPRATELAPLMSLAATGVELLALEPSSNAPELLIPQQLMDPLARRAHE